LKLPLPAAKLKSLLAATVVEPFKLTLPVPVENVPEPVWARTPVKVLSPAKLWVPVVTTPASVKEALDTVKAIVSGLGPALRVMVTPATLPLTAVSIKLALVADVPLTKMSSPVPLAPASGAQAQTSVVSLNFRMSPSAQPWSKVTPELNTSRPEPDEVGL
jgi:hypothetical protein